MFWFIFGIVAASFTLGAIIGYKFHDWKELKIIHGIRMHIKD